jgi:glutamate dehydrogenase/leucine dehydrogenase
MCVADLITGFGVAIAVRRWHQTQGRTLEGVRVSLEGFGNVGAACGIYLTRAGARIVAVRDAQRTLLAPDGLGGDDFTALLAQRTDKLLPADDARATPNADCTAFHDTPADVFVCAAISESLTPPVLDRLEHAGVRAIACGANQPFREAKTGATRVAQNADRRFALLADVVANCGMARAFSYLMEPGAHTDAASVFAATERTISDTLDEIVDRAGAHDAGLLAATLGLTLDRVSR